MKKLVFLLSLIIIINSCDIQSIDNYKGAIIHEKQNPAAGERLVIESKISGKYIIKTIYVTHYDYLRYNIGDTIK